MPASDYSRPEYSMFGDPPSLNERLQFDLWVGARDLDLERVRAALEAGAPADPVILRSPDGMQSPLALAVTSYIGYNRRAIQDTIVDLLLAGGASPLGVDASGKSAIDKVIVGGQPEYVAKFIALLPEGVDAQKFAGSRPLAVAVKSLQFDKESFAQVPRPAIIRQLLEAGANPNSLPVEQREQYGFNPLSAAAHYLSIHHDKKYLKDPVIQAIDALIEYQATPTLAWHSSSTLLIWSMLLKHDPDGTWTQYLGRHPALDADVEKTLSDKVGPEAWTRLQAARLDVAWKSTAQDNEQAGPRPFRM